jgi:hypothetical protein
MLQGNIPDGYELIPVDQLTNEYEVVPFDKVIEVLNVSSVSKVPELETEKVQHVYPYTERPPGSDLPIDVHHINRQLSSGEGEENHGRPAYGKPHHDPGYIKMTSTKKPVYLPSFFTDTNRLLSMFKPPPFSPGEKQSDYFFFTKCSL